VRVGVAGGQETQRRIERQVAAEGGVPLRPEQFQVAVEPGDDRAAALDQAGAEFRCAAQRISRAQALGRAQPVRVQQRQPGQDAGIEPVGFDVLGVIIPQVRGLLGRDMITVAPCRRNQAASGTQALRVGSITTVTAAPAGTCSHSRARSAELVRNL
jgi:hypothetical protein